MYKLVKDKDTQELVSVTKNDGSGLVLSIPFAPDNTDYQEYLKWIALGNTPQEAE